MEFKATQVAPGQPVIRAFEQTQTCSASTRRLLHRPSGIYPGSTSSCDGDYFVSGDTELEVAGTGALHQGKGTKQPLPVAVCIHECELKANEAVQVGVVIPGRFVQEEDVPIRHQEKQAAEAVETPQHNSQSTCTREAETR